MITFAILSYAAILNSCENQLVSMCSKFGVIKVYVLALLYYSHVSYNDTSVYMYFSQPHTACTQK